MQELQVGERVLSEVGAWLRIESLRDTQTYAVVYNFRVAGAHTYFVGCPEWGFSVWVHNAYITQNRVQGLAAENRIMKKLQNNRSIEILGTHVRVRTPYNLHYREIDILVRKRRTGELIAIEVKSGSGKRNESQVLKDQELAAGSITRFFGRQAREAGFLQDQLTGPIRTIVIHVQ